jgi:small subunit ribosomal protein S6
MKVYELMVILRGDLDEDTYKKASEKVEKTIKSKHGTVTSLDEWGKRKLAYQIKRQDFGYYVVIRYTSDEATAPHEIQQTLAIDENVLRSMTVIAKSTKRTEDSEESKPATKKVTGSIEEPTQA